MTIGKVIARMFRKSFGGKIPADQARAKRTTPDIADYIEAKLAFAQRVERELP